MDETQYQSIWLPWFNSVIYPAMEHLRLRMATPTRCVLYDGKAINRDNYHVTQTHCRAKVYPKFFHSTLSSSIFEKAMQFMDPTPIPTPRLEGSSLTTATIITALFKLTFENNTSWRPSIYFSSDLGHVHKEHCLCAIHVNKQDTTYIMFCIYQSAMISYLGILVTITNYAAD